MSLPDVARLRLAAQRISQPIETTPEGIVTHLGAVQAQDYAGALWAIGLRIAGATRAGVERAIAEGTIIRTWPMRGTLHFVPAADARWMLELMAPRIMKGWPGRNRQLGLDEAAFARSRSLVEGALKRAGVLSRRDVFAALEAGGEKTTGQRGIHILQRLCMECMLCHGPHAEKQPTFVLFDNWVRSSRPLDRDDALRTIATRYFTSHGPASLRDFVWWTMLTVADARRALEMARPSLERMVAGDVELWMAAGLRDADANASRTHLLPGFDEYLLGYKDRSTALPARYAHRIVPGGNGVFLPTLVFDGQVRGTWRRKTGPASVTLDAIPFARLTSVEKKAFAASADKYARFLGSAAKLAWS